MNSITSSAICRGRQPSGSKASSMVTITFVGSWLGRATGSKTPSSAGREPLLEPSGFCSPPHPSTRRARISNGKILVFMRCPFLLCVLFGSAERAHSTPGRRSTPRERPGFWLRAEDEILEGNQAVPGSLAHGLGAVVDLKLGVEGRDVELDGVLADVELAGYEPVGEPATKQLQNLALARGQRLGERLSGRARNLDTAWSSSEIRTSACVPSSATAMAASSSNSSSARRTTSASESAEGSGAVGEAASPTTCTSVPSMLASIERSPARVTGVGATTNTRFGVMRRALELPSSRPRKRSYRRASRAGARPPRRWR